MKKLTLNQVQTRVNKVQNNRIKIISGYKNRRTPVIVKCMICGLKWKCNVGTLLIKPVGVNCNHHLKMTLEQVQSKIDKMQSNRIKIIGKYKNSRTPVMVKCTVCGLEWECIPDTLLERPIGVGCKHHIKLTQEMAIKRIANASNNRIEMIGKYNGAKTKTTMLCHKCGYQWETTPYSIYAQNVGCLKCSNKIPLTTKIVKQRMHKEVGNEYTLLSDVHGTHEPIKVRHNKCGTIFETDPNRFLIAKSRCRKCQTIKTHLKQMTPLNIAQNNMDINRDCEFVIDKSTYHGVAKPCWIHHKTCNKQFWSCPWDVINHQGGCPFCYSSYGEEAVRNYLNFKNCLFEEQYRIPECKNIRALPFDFAIFNSNHELLFLIEYQGIQHYKPKFGDKEFRLTKKRDEIKLNFCSKHKIKLIRIPYKRWYGRFDDLQKQVNSYLNNEISMSIPNQAM